MNNARSSRMYQMNPMYLWQGEGGYFENIHLARVFSMLLGSKRGTSRYIRYILALYRCLCET